MATINQVKELGEADTPILFFECTLPSGDLECWSTHSIVFNGQPYSARVLRHDLFDLQLSADDAMDGMTQISLVLANADSAMSELNAAIGFKGTRLTVYFAFADLPTLSITTESTVLFRGVAGDPDAITEESLTVSFTNKLSLQRIPLPEVRIQRSCPWTFPTSLAQRTEAVDGGASGRFSRYFRCGYSADVSGGVGTLSNGEAFTSCDGSRSQCQQRGMFSVDSANHVTHRFGGFEFVPSAIQVRTSGQKTSHLSAVQDDNAKYNDPVPVVYGTGWLKTPIIFSRNDGNLTHMEALIGMGQIQGVVKVVVNDVEIPSAVQGTDMTSTGWYNVVTSGTRTGTFNLDFTDANGNPLGDPYGSMCVLSAVVPNRISSGKSLANVEVLVQGMQIDTYNGDGTFYANSFSNNPAWVILDILERSGWAVSDLNLPTFAASAAFCATLISTTDLNGNPLQVPRYECNLVLTKRQSAAVVVRGIRVASSLMLRYGPTGLLELLPETTVANQQAALPSGSNSTEPLYGGWPAYEFSDASGPFSGIVRNLNGSSSVVLTSRSISETSNRLSVEFQDEVNEYQQDSLSVVDAGDAALIGYEISSQSTALGVANFSQANRVLLRQLDKSTKGNLFVQFQTSFRALTIRPGDLIALTYLKEGFYRVPFRVMKLSPSMNYQLITVSAQVHDDDWYSDNPAVLAGAGRQPGSGIQTPRPLIGLVPHDGASGTFEFFDFRVQEKIQAQVDGTATDIVSIDFAVPSRPSSTLSNLPLLSLSPDHESTGGALPGGASLYYAVTAVDGSGREGALSFTVAASVPKGTNTNSVQISGLSFPRGAGRFNVYRGATPQMLYRIASGIPVSNSYTDVGNAPQPIGPPDANFDHANLYWRMEYAGPFPADTFSTSTVGWSDMGAASLAYSGMAVRIIEGTGVGQERSIATNDQTVITITSPWSTVPDVTSVFVIAQASWQFAAVSASSPAQFQIPYQAGTVIEISGRGANVNNLEGTADLCPLTRVALGGGQTDTGTASAPQFSLQAPGGGNLSVFNVGFDDLADISSISSGTLSVFYWNELETPSAYSLTSAVALTSSSITLNRSPSAVATDYVQIGAELMTVIGVDSTGTVLSVTRGAFGSVASTHAAGDAVFNLQSSTFVLPFALGFFADVASINYLHTLSLPDVRVVAAEMFVTNAFGDSQGTQHNYAGTGGLRTLSGGQYTMQVSGFLATQRSVAPPLLVEATHAVRDIRATLSQAASGYSIQVDVLHDGGAYVSLTIGCGASTSAIIDGSGLPPLPESSNLTANVTLTALTGFQPSPSPGRDLTVTIRL